MQRQIVAERELSETAPAKINLDLRITGRRADGYHELDSLVVFAPLGDRLSLLDGDVGDDALELELAGPFAQRIEGDNLVLGAARALRAAAGVRAGARLLLDKHLPVAGGIGGGSSDAAAALRLLARHWQVALDPLAMGDIALSIGADVPACLHRRTVRMRGIGERLDPVRGLPALPMVLVNPQAPLATAAVFRALGELPPPRPRPQLRVGLGLVPFALWLKESANHMEEAARGLLPPVGEVLAALRAQDGILLARMSGSGPSCFGIFMSMAAAEAAATALQAAEPGWWVRPFMIEAG